MSENLSHSEPEQTFVPSFENPGSTTEQINQPRPDSVLRELGDAIIQRALSPDLAAAVIQHQSETGVESTNKHAPGFFIGNPENGVPMSADHSYRSVDQRAINDLIDTGIVRGAYTATEGQRKNGTDYHATHWSDGKDNLNHGFRSPGSFVIEANTAHLDQPVTADKIRGVYAHAEDGSLMNIIDQQK